MRKYLVEFTDHMRVEKNYSPKTIENYYNDIKQYSNMMDIYDINNMSKQNIRSYLSKIELAGIAPSSRNRKLAALRSFCRFLCEEDYIKSNPAADIHTAKLNKKLPIVMSEIETASMIESTTNTRDRAVLEILYGIGVRVSELRILKFRDIDFIARRVRVFGKGGKERIVPINRCSMDMVTDLIDERGGVEPDDYLFPSPNNSIVPISAKAIYDIVIKYAKINNLKGITPHKFRHTYATILHAKDMDIRDIQELLGHVDISTTQMYTKVLHENLSAKYHLLHPRS